MVCLSTFKIVFNSMFLCTRCSCLGGSLARARAEDARAGPHTEHVSVYTVHVYENALFAVFNSVCMYARFVATRDKYTCEPSPLARVLIVQGVVGSEQ